MSQDSYDQIASIIGGLGTGSYRDVVILRGLSEVLLPLSSQQSFLLFLSDKNHELSLFLSSFLKGILYVPDPDLVISFSSLL